MKQIISILLVLSILLTYCPQVYASDNKSEKLTAQIKVYYSDNPQNLEYLSVMKINNNLYVSAEELGTRLGYKVSIGKDAVSLQNEKDDFPVGITIFFYNTTDVKHMVLTRMLDYEAPYESIKDGNIAWIPLQFALLILGSGFLKINDALCIDIPKKSIIDVFYDTMKNASEYNFDYEKDFGYGESNWFWKLFGENTDVEVIGDASHVINVFNGMLTGDSSSWGEYFASYISDSSCYNISYANDLALLMCTMSDSELDEMKDNVSALQDFLGSSDSVAEIFDSFAIDLDDDIDKLMDKCSELFQSIKEENSSVAEYNKAYAALENTLDEQTWLMFGNSVLTGASSFLTPFLKILEYKTYCKEFENRNSFAIDSLGYSLSQFDSNSSSSELIKLPMEAYIKTIDTNSFVYAGIRYITENAGDWITSGLSISSVLSLDSTIALIAWNLLSSLIPGLSNKLEASDKFELSLYGAVLSGDLYLQYQSRRNEIFNSTEEITSDKLYEISQLCYAYLKSCYIERDAAVASLEGKRKSVQEQIQPLIDEQNAINDKIAHLLTILKDADLDNSHLCYGLLPENNKTYLSNNDEKLMEHISDLLYHKCVGKVVDENNNSLSADIIISTNNGDTETIQSDDNGKYAILLQPGKYTLTVDAGSKYESNSIEIEVPDWNTVEYEIPVICLEKITKEKVYGLYKQLIEQYEKTYGQANTDSKQLSSDFSTTWMTGLCYLELIDFDNNGIEELLLIYKKTQQINNDYVGLDYVFEVWGYEQKDIHLLDSGELYGGDGGSKTLIKTYYNDNTYILSGSSDSFEYNYYHGYNDNGNFGIVREALMDEAINGNNGYYTYKINGSAVSQEEWENTEREWSGNSNSYPMNNPSGLPDDGYSGNIHKIKEAEEKLGMDVSNLSDKENIDDIYSKLCRSEWYNEAEYPDNWATRYCLDFDLNGSIQLTGYRNKDIGTYQIQEDDTILATFSENYYDSPGYGYKKLDYSYTMTITVDNQKIYCDFDKTFEDSYNSNAQDGWWYKDN